MNRRILIRRLYPGNPARNTQALYRRKLESMGYSAVAERLREHGSKSFRFVWLAPKL